MRCIAIDDEKWALELVADNIRHVPYLQLVGRCRNAREASELLQSEKVDLIFLDVQMPGLNGLQFIQTLPIPPMVIFITAYEQFALEGFNVSAIDYLVKPVSLERFIKACNKAKAIHDLRHATTPGDVDYFFVNVEYSRVRIAFDDIKFIEGLKDYIKIYLVSSARPVITRMSLKSLEEKLPSNRFVRTHKSFIVSMAKITSIKRDFILIHETEIPVGESYKASIEKITGSGT
jgi:two-component system, LytTR family, response regulator